MAMITLLTAILDLGGFGQPLFELPPKSITMSLVIDNQTIQIVEIIWL